MVNASILVFQCGVKIRRTNCKFVDVCAEPVNWYRWQCEKYFFGILTKKLAWKILRGTNILFEK